IGGWSVTGVQTCALPISLRCDRAGDSLHCPNGGVPTQGRNYRNSCYQAVGADEELLAIVGSWRDTLDDAAMLTVLREYNATAWQIGRASCRERAYIPAGG